MDGSPFPLPSFVQRCHCGRSFTHENAFTNHARTCSKTKRRVTQALSKAKELWNSRKRRRIEPGSHNSPYDRGSYSAEGGTLESGGADPRAQAPDDTGLSLAERRPRRLDRQMPKRFRDNIPQSLHSLPPAFPASTPPHNSAEAPPLFDSPSLVPSMAPPLFRRILKSAKNIFGLFRQYQATDFPTHDPEERTTLRDLTNFESTFQTHSSSDIVPGNGAPSSFYPYPNQSSFRLGEWYWKGTAQKSQASFKELLDIVGDCRFSPDDVRSTNWHQVDQKLADSLNDEWVDIDADWIKTNIQISVPFHKSSTSPGPKDYVAENFYHRSLVAVIRDKLENHTECEDFHFEPYELYWQPKPSGDPVRVHGELYTSPAFMEAHQKLQDLPYEPGCSRPRVVVGLQFWSDATHLTSFGDAKLWPLYLWFGNESKYHRCMPSRHLCHHVAYFQKLPDAFKDFAVENWGGKGPTPEFMAHCNREFFHAQWDILLDDEFLEVYRHGLVVTCRDGVERRFFPRFFTYSADYPEKILLSSVRNHGACPCPRCLIPLSRLRNLGMARDKKERKTLARKDDAPRQNAIAIARTHIYNTDHQVNSTAVERLLKPQSLVPSKNAFSTKLTPLGIDIFRMFVVDFLYEVEIGVWKMLLIHLLRMLEACKEGHLHELDRRYRQVPTFGNGTIRRFAKNTSELKKLAARDFEDLLQCAIPVFDSLFPGKHNRTISRLLFVFAHWHSLAKLRIHTDYTLAILENVTRSLGQLLRDFQQKTCPAFHTQELKREADARKRRGQKQDSRLGKQPPLSLAHPVEEPSGSTTQTTTAPARRPKVFTLDTYKVHALGDYVECIRRYGTTDSYSTEVGELEHRTPKGWYRRTSRKDYVKQMTQIERRQARIRRIRAKLGAMPSSTGKSQGTLHIDTPNIADVHHIIGISQNLPCDIPLFLRKYFGDPAIKDFVPQLKRHLLPRVLTMLQSEAAALQDQSPSCTDLNSSSRLSSEPPTSSGESWSSVFFKNDRIYSHKLARFNYTTYDVRRAQDVVNPSTSHHNIMVLANHSSKDGPTQHPFWYARVLGIYHANVIYTGPGMLDYNPRRMEFLWVRWYEIVEEHMAGWDACQLDRIRFPPMATDGAFGFLDPKDVLRGCHIIPAFADGKVHADGAGLSHCIHDSEDWKGYFVNRFVDRDMTMRYHWGLGIGHLYATSDAVFQPRNTDENVLRDKDQRPADTHSSESEFADRPSAEDLVPNSVANQGLEDAVDAATQVDQWHDEDPEPDIGSDFDAQDSSEDDEYLAEMDDLYGDSGLGQEGSYD
ncbi:hypothetical protein BJ138DRAFT_1019068 [Hygrophoropsis aurantiaca]|uniref:Uncharacterized protein n=1 Tax=Hygrophoropsis aurantiaca TaxID=72124 RepID=A0ACB7ZTN1_9AGAM|nr:hypothetical protein BJ138DRAFT_1019068 [Hygrophoropsis aurantiaca]